MYGFDGHCRIGQILRLSSISRSISQIEIICLIFFPGGLVSKSFFTLFADIPAGDVHPALDMMRQREQTVSLEG